MEFFDTVVTKQAKLNVMDVLNSGYLGEGEWVTRFEKELEKQFDYCNGVAVNSCTSALHLALILAEIGQGDEVILPAQTFVATGLAVLYCGARPVFADIEMDGNISVDSVASKITEKTKAVIAVAWGGASPDLLRLRILCDKFRLMLIVDNAHALGAKTKGEDFSCFSFQAIKHLTTGDGGLLVCRSEIDYSLARRLRWFGISKENDLSDKTGERLYDLWDIGYKYNMNNVSAALGLGNLKMYKENQERRDFISMYYNTHIDQKYWASGWQLHSKHWLYDLLVDKRDDFLRAMQSRSIPTSVVHQGIDRNKIFGGKVMGNKNQRVWDKKHVCLPVHPKMSIKDCEKVVESFKAGW